jgi:hypothetical protein
MLVDALLSPVLEMALALAVGALVMRWLESRRSAELSDGEPRCSALDHLCCDQEDVAGALLLWVGREWHVVLDRGKRLRAARPAARGGCPERA